MSDTDLVEAVVCLANGAGGVLLIGVEDDGRVMGARPRHHRHTDPLRLQALIQGRTVPPVVTDIAVVPVHGRDVIVIRVPKMDRPVATSAGRYLRRATGADGRPTCVPMFLHEMYLSAPVRAADYTALPVPEASWSDLDPLEFERVRQVIRRYHGDAVLATLDDLEMAKALGAVVANGEVRQITVAG
ncbi:MAG TPA: ATP-binding protein, partial [Limnochordales bacterium]